MSSEFKLCVRLFVCVCVFVCGDGRISELLSRWLGRLGLTPRTFVQRMEAVTGDSEDKEEVTGARRLVEAARGCWPHSSEVSEAGIWEINGISEIPPIPYEIRKGS